MLTFEDRWSMCRPSKIDGRCEIRLIYLLKTLILYISCMRITPRVCTSVLSLVFVIRISVPFHGSVPNESFAVFHGLVVCAVKT